MRPGNMVRFAKWDEIIDINDWSTTPKKNIGLLPNFDINKELGRVEIIVDKNCKLSGNVDIQPYGAIKYPAKAVVIILIFIAVIEKACETAK